MVKHIYRWRSHTSSAGRRRNPSFRAKSGPSAGPFAPTPPRQCDRPNENPTSGEPRSVGPIGFWFQENPNVIEWFCSFEVWKHFFENPLNSNWRIELLWAEAKCWTKSASTAVASQLQTKSTQTSPKKMHSRDVSSSKNVVICIFAPGDHQESFLLAWHEQVLRIQIDQSAKPFKGKKLNKRSLTQTTNCLRADALSILPWTKWWFSKLYGNFVLGVSESNVFCADRIPKQSQKQSTSKNGSVCKQIGPKQFLCGLSWLSAFGA